MKRYVGGSISEAYLSYGQPETIFDLPDGRRAFQFYWGAGSGVIPTSQQTKIRPAGLNGYDVTTTGTPAMAYQSKGCLISLIARPTGGDYIVEEYRIPKDLVC
ncbi:hypothetical protein G7A66_00065 [Altererythrobacter sp. SALINAS58]|uniref:hypothetical protein n=1 Tax=Alteripontixanthobacter muriae TaxID=2705546 RepID=UPI001575EAD4|nr:hypothetical protein [Alteripontixanthobacter muriae]NTZ41511.1 hypothetical protein [Alteripontixanthobacter muriae]